MARGKQADSESGSEDADMKEAASSEAEPMSEDEAASSAEEASDEAEEGSEEEESDSDAPKVELPNRTTRGKRMVLDQESGDEEFWEQEFFAEEHKDEEYSAASDSSDTADSDISKSEDEGSSDDEGGNAESKGEPKRKVLKPPGAKAAGRPRGPGRPPATAEVRAARKAARAEKAEKGASEPQAARMLRKSTVQRAEEAEIGRQLREETRPVRKRTVVHHKQLTQDELLAEAARTEIENLKDLEVMVAMEEATKKKATAKKAKYSGPMVRFHSRKVDGAGATFLEVKNMLTPAWLQPQKAPPAPTPAVCEVTGKPARYRDPKTGKGYHDAAAFKELRRRHGERMAARLTAPLARPQGPAVAQGSYPVAVSVAVPGSSPAGAATSMATTSPVSGPIPGSAPAQYGALPGAHPSPQQPRYEPQSGHPGVYHQAGSPAQPSALQQTPAGAHATASSAAVVPQYQQPQHQQPPQQQQQRASAPFPAQPPHTAQGFSQPLPLQQYQHQAPVGAGSQQEPVPQHMYQQAATATVPQHVAAVSQQPGAALASWGAEAQGTSALADGDMQQQGLPPQQLPHGSM